MATVRLSATIGPGARADSERPVADHRLAGRHGDAPRECWIRETFGCHQLTAVGELRTEREVVAAEPRTLLLRQRPPALEGLRVALNQDHVFHDDLR